MSCFCKRSEGKRVAMALATRGHESIIIQRDEIMGLYIEDANGGVKEYLTACPMCGRRLRGEG